MGSTWQCGPGFLKEPREVWPLRVPDDPDAVPEAAFRKGMKAGVAMVVEADLGLSNVLAEILRSCGSLEKAVGVTARLLRACGTGGDVDAELRVNPGPDDRAAAFKLLMHQEQRDVRGKEREGKLASLAPYVVKREPRHLRGLVVTRGRIPSEVLSRLTGLEALPILSGS